MGDHYKVLGLSNKASKEEIKEAFRKLALKFHPDKHTQSSKAVRERATQRFKQLSEAYDILSDDRKRADYNNYYYYNYRRSTNNAAGHGDGGFNQKSSSTKKNQRNYRQRTSPSNVQDFNPLRLARSLFLNLAFAGVLLGGAVLIGRTGEALWKMRNPGKSFEEAMESIEKTKTKKEKR